MNTSKNMNDRQAEAAYHKGGPLLIAAGAGSGKTHTLTQRLHYLLNELKVPPARILAITFTNKAAEEMKKRAGAPKELFIGTFHSFGARLLRAEARRLGRSVGFTIFDEDDTGSLLKKIGKNRNLPKETCGPAVLSRLMGKVKSEFIAPEMAAKGTRDLDPDTARACYEDYENLLKENNAFDFDDLIEKPVQLFRNYPEVLELYRGKYDHVLIDEYQDINASQYELVRCLAGGHGNLSVVGDDAQSIYAFRGADFRNFLNFERDWPAAKIVMLEENYRSTPLILEAANDVIGHNKTQRKKNLWTKNAQGEKIQVFAAENEYMEAEWIVKTAITNWRKGKPLESMAVIYRTNAQSRPIEQALISAGVPYRMFGGIRFYERKEIKDIVAGLRLAANPLDTVSAERLDKNFSKGKSRLLIDALPKMGSASPSEIIDYFVSNTNYLDYLKNNYKNSQERIENVQGLLTFARDFAKDGLAAFLEQATLAQSHDNPSGKTGVNLMSIHMSKGLEFESVFVAGVGEGTLPHHRALSSGGEMEEERRLMYVAITRAAKHLHMSFSNVPSRFLYEISGDLVEFVNNKVSSNRPNRQGMPDEEEMWLDYD